MSTADVPFQWVIGTPVLYEHPDGEGKGLWSGVVTEMHNYDGEDCATVYMDGIIVPTMMRCGIQGPNSWTDKIGRPVRMLKVRQAEADDDQKRALWAAKKELYYAAQEAAEVAAHNAKKQRFSFVEAGMTATHNTSGQGKVVSVLWETLYVIVDCKEGRCCWRLEDVVFD